MAFTSSNQRAKAYVSDSSLVSAFELVLGAAIVIGHNVFHLVLNEVPILFVLLASLVSPGPMIASPAVRSTTRLRGRRTRVTFIGEVKAGRGYERQFGSGLRFALLNQKWLMPNCKAAAC